MVPESNEKSHTAAPVVPDEESDAELDRYGAIKREEMENKCQYLHFLAIAVYDFVWLSDLQQSRALPRKLH